MEKILNKALQLAVKDIFNRIEESDCPMTFYYTSEECDSLFCGRYSAPPFETPKEDCSNCVFNFFIEQAKTEPDKRRIFKKE